MIKVDTFNLEDSFNLTTHEILEEVFSSAKNRSYHLSYVAKAVAISNKIIIPTSIEEPFTQYTCYVIDIYGDQLDEVL